MFNHQCPFLRLVLLIFCIGFCIKHGLNYVWNGLFYLQTDSMKTQIPREKLTLLYGIKQSNNTSIPKELVKIISLFIIQKQIKKQWDFIEYHAENILPDTSYLKPKKCTGNTNHCNRIVTMEKI